MSTRDELEEIYARIPRIACKGLCYECCGPIILHQDEQRRMERRAGHPLMFSAETGRCNMLSADNCCSVYRERPLVCRLWGVTKGLPCLWGCQPDRVMSDDEGRHLLHLMRERLGDRIEPSYPDDWTELEIKHRQFRHRTLQYGPIHAPWPHQR